MKINNNHTNIYSQNFQGYGARKLKGLVMNSNYDGIADEMKRIGELENFKVFMFKREYGGVKLLADKFKHTKAPNGCWAQDYWGIIGNTLLSCESSAKGEYLKKMLNLKSNPVQDEFRDAYDVYNKQTYVNFLSNLKVIEKDGQMGVEVPTIDGNVFVRQESYVRELSININILTNLLERTHIKGGNYFINKDSNGEDYVFVGKNELKKFNIKELSEMMGTSNIFIIPQADYHLDLFIRPLKDKKVLLADDRMMLQTLKNGLEKIKNKAINSPASERNKYRDAVIRLNMFLNTFEQVIKQNPYEKTSTVEEFLTKAGFEVIKVPARFYAMVGEENELLNRNVILKHHLNFINAIVHINDKDELVYITNKSYVDDRLGLTKEIQELTGFSLEKAFVDAIKPHVDKVYFVSGETNEVPNYLLPKCYGGIHCMGMEIV